MRSYHDTNANGDLVVAHDWQSYEEFDQWSADDCNCALCVEQKGDNEDE